MRWKLIFMALVSTNVVIVPLILLKINFIIGFFISVFGAYVILCLWVVIIDKKISNILDKECDPLRYIEKCSESHIYKPLHRDLNMILAYNCLGRHDDAYELLQNIEIPNKALRVLQIKYHIMYMNYYLFIEDLEKVSLEYEKHIKKLRKNILIPSLIFSFDILVLYYHYKVNMTPDTAKYYLEQVKYLYDIYSYKLCKRQKLAVRYIQAELFAELGDIENAILNYEKVAKNGNKLWIAKSSLEKLEQIESIV